MMGNNSPPPMTLTTEEHVALLKQALDVLLTARTSYDAWTEQRQKRTPLQLVPWSYFVTEPLEKQRLKSLIRDPVRYALRKQIRTIGKELHQLLGNSDAMLTAAEEVAAKDYQYRMSIIDKAWDGIGTWYA